MLFALCTVRIRDYMDPVQIAKMIEEKFPGQVLGSMTHAGQLGVMLRKDMISDICRYLKDEPLIKMNHLADLTRWIIPPIPETRGRGSRSCITSSRSFIIIGYG